MSHWERHLSIRMDTTRCLVQSKETHTVNVPNKNELDEYVNNTHANTLMQLCLSDPNWIYTRDYVRDVEK